MPQRPFEYLTDFIKEKTERNRKLTEYVHTQTDSLVTWLIGFSFTGLLLIVANLKNLRFRTPTKSIIICLFICITLGIVFRYVSYLMTIFQKSLDDYFYGLFTDSMTPTTLDEDIENMNYDELLFVLKNDFDETINYPIVLNEKEKADEEPRLRKHYLALLEYSKKSFEIGLNHIAEIDETAYKIKKDKTVNKLKNLNETLKKSRVGYNYKVWSMVRGILYLLCLISFLAAVSILCVSLLMMA